MEIAYDAASAGPRPVGHRNARAALLAVSALLAFPYLVMGPGFILDDWIFVSQRHFDGFFGTTTEPDWLLEARPGAWLTFQLIFGLFYEYPAAVFVVQTAVNAAAAVAFHALLRRFLPERHAFATATIWLLLPIRSSVDHWAAAINIAVAYLLLVLGLTFLVDAARGAARWPHAIGCLVASTLCYESVIAIAGTAVAAVLLLVPSVRRQACVALVSLLATGLWMLAFTPKSTNGEAFDYSAAPSALFGGPAFGGASTIAVFFLLMGLLMAWRRRSTEMDMFSVGVAVIALSFLVFARFSIVPRGIGDRVNAVGSFGVALVITAAVLALSGRRTWVAIAACALVMIPVRIDNDADYAWSADHVLELMLNARNDGKMMFLGDCPLYKDHVTGLQGHWDGGPAVRYYFKDRDLEGGYIQDAPFGRHRKGDQCTNDTQPP